MPASPTTRNDRPRPPTASSRPARNSTSSWYRPTKTASVRWWGGGIAEIIPLSRVHGKDGMPPARFAIIPRRAPHARVRGRGLLAREHGQEVREGARPRLPAELGRGEGPG